MEGLEAEVVRLTTELTMAKAELDGAYGSRAERAKEAQAAEIQALTEQNNLVVAELQSLRSAHDSLQNETATLRSAPPQDNSRTAALEQELQGMVVDFQELTRESLQLEHERAQLDALIDGLRDRCETLEGQLSDERVRWLGVKSPSAGRESMIGREMTSTMVLRQEFKKMMRETRAEGLRLLRVSSSNTPNNTAFPLQAKTVTDPKPPDRTRRTPPPGIRSPPLAWRQRSSARQLQQ